LLFAFALQWGVPLTMMVRFVRDERWRVRKAKGLWEWVASASSYSAGYRRLPRSIRTKRGRRRGGSTTTV